MLKIIMTVLTAMTLIAVHELGDSYTDPQPDVYARENSADADTARVLTMAVRRIAANVAMLPTLLARDGKKG